MNTYTAIFRHDDVVTRTSRKPYTHAWQVYASDGRVIGVGFATSHAIAQARAGEYERRCVRNGVSVLSRNGYEVVPVTVT